MNPSLSRSAITLALVLGFDPPNPVGFTASGFGLIPRITIAQAAFARPARCGSHRWHKHSDHCRNIGSRQRAMAHVLSSARGMNAPVNKGSDATLPSEPVHGIATGGLERDSEHMRRALELAAKGLGCTRPNPAVGCVILDKSGEVVGEGFHPRAGEPHAEVWALREAGERARGGTAYVTLEPCNHFGRTPPCTTALIESGVARVVAGMVDPDPRTAGSGLRRLSEAGLDVSVGVEGAACQALNAPFVHRILEQSCYGVLHCALHASSPGKLEDTQSEPELILTPDSSCYTEYDAVVVEGKAGIKKLEACMESLADTIARVVIVRSRDGVEGELGPLTDSKLWTDVPRGTIIIAAMPRKAARENETEPSGPAQASLTERGVEIIDCPVPSVRPCQPSDLAEAVQDSELEADIVDASVIVETVAKELHRRGLLSAAWDVGPVLAAGALGGSHIQRALVRRRGRRSAGWTDRDTAGVSSASVSGTSSTSAAASLEGSGSARVENPDAESAVETLQALSGKSGVRVRDAVGPLSPSAVEERDFVSVLIPAVSLSSQVSS